MPLSLALAKAFGAAELSASILGKAQWVFGRCSAHRRDQFFQALQEDLQVEMASGVTEHSVDDALNKLLATEEGQELLFDAFRRVCFAKSRTYGPRIIGLLTAQLLNECRKSTEDEDMIFEVAEVLSDAEFLAFEKRYEQCKGGRLIAAMKILTKRDEIQDLFYHDCTSFDPFTPSLRNKFGSWAHKIESIGLITSETTTIEENQGHKRVSVKVLYTAPCLRLFTLLLRAKLISRSA